MSLQPDSTPEAGITLREYLAILRERKWTIVLVTCLAVGSALYFTYQQTPLYTSESKVLVTAAATNSPLFPQVNMETERGLVESWKVAEIVRGKLGLGRSIEDVVKPLDVSVETGTEILHVDYTAPNPLRAQKLSQAFAEAYLQFRQGQAGGPDGEIVQPAELPESPSSAGYLQNGGLALIVGLALGVGLAFVRERLDDRLRGREDLEDRLRVPVLAVIPKIPGWRDRRKTRLTMMSEPRGGASEVYRTLRTSLLFMAGQRPLRTILVVSPSAGEGKTTTAANLAVVLAQAGKSVIAVSADLRKPRIHQFFDLSNDYGVVDILTGERDLTEVIQQTDIPGLTLLACGQLPARPAELLQTPQAEALLKELQTEAEFVIIDSAPALVVADPLAWAPMVDGVLFVAMADITTRHAVARARDQLEQVGADVVGSVLNAYDPKSRSGQYYYRYYYQYSPEQPGPTGNGRTGEDRAERRTPGAGGTLPPSG